MKSHNSYVKVRYAETDQMGVVYHGNYAQYLEIARIDWLDAIGISYKKMEEEGPGGHPEKKLSGLFEKWLMLMVSKHRLDTFKTIKSRLL